VRRSLASAAPKCVRADLKARWIAAEVGQRAFPVPSWVVAVGEQEDPADFLFRLDRVDPRANRQMRQLVKQEDRAGFADRAAARAYISMLADAIERAELGLKRRRLRCDYGSGEAPMQAAPDVVGDALHRRLCVEYGGGAGR
jgi:hypothetical protein